LFGEEHAVLRDLMTSCGGNVTIWSATAVSVVVNERRSSERNYQINTSEDISSAQDVSICKKSTLVLSLVNKDS
jgi:hypothetical protein